MCNDKILNGFLSCSEKTLTDNREKTSCTYNSKSGFEHFPKMKMPCYFFLRPGKVRVKKV